MGEAMFVVFVSCIALSCAIMIGENQFLKPFFFLNKYLDIYPYRII